MPDRDDIEKAIAILGGGRAYGLYRGARSAGGYMRRRDAVRAVLDRSARASKPLAKYAGKGARTLFRQGVTKNPYGVAALLVYEGIIRRDQINEVARKLGGDALERGGGFISTGKRKLSKANKAMKQAMKATGNNFKQASKIASKANPATKSKIGKGTSSTKRLARKIRKSIWGVTKRLR